MKRKRQLRSGDVVIVALTHFQEEQTLGVVTGPEGQWFQVLDMGARGAFITDHSYPLSYGGTYTILANLGEL